MTYHTFLILFGADIIGVVSAMSAVRAAAQALVLFPQLECNDIVVRRLNPGEAYSLLIPVA